MLQDQGQRTEFWKYTLLFLLLLPLVFLPFLLEGASFLWHIDGLYQHYNAFLYLGDWLRDILRSIFVEHKPVIPMWEHGIGYGADVITTLSYYVIGDPFALISVLTPGKLSEAGYTISILLRYYAAGLAFLVYARRMKANRQAAVLCAAAYVFCAYACFAGVRHPYFLNPMIYLPLLLTGAEQLLANESRKRFVIMVFVSAISNFYFFYMLVLFTVLYTVVRVLTDANLRHIRTILQLILRFVGCGLLGVMLSAVLFLPNVMNFLENSRMGGSYRLPLAYRPEEYARTVLALVTRGEATSWKFLGIAPALLPCAYLLFVKRGRHAWLRCLLLLCLAFACIPAVGYVFNGFGYATDRWVFGYALLVLTAAAIGAGEVDNLTRKQWILWITLTGSYVIISLFLAVFVLHYWISEVLIGDGLMLAAIGLLRLRANAAKAANTAKLQKVISGLLVLLTVGSVLNLSYAQYWGNHYVTRFAPAGTGYAQLTADQKDVPFSADRNAGAFAAGQKDVPQADEENTWYRVDHTEVDNSRLNVAISGGQSTTMMYWSLISPDIVQFVTDLGAYQEQTYRLRGLQQRSYLLPLVSAKYFIAGELPSQQASVPAWYQACSENCYCTEYSLPFGYTSDQVISRSRFLALTIVQRQQAMLQGIVVEDEDRAELSFADAKPDYAEEILPYTIAACSGLTVSGHTFTAEEPGGSITLQFDAPENCELYVYLSGLSAEPADDTITRLPIMARTNVTAEAVYYTDADIYAHGRTEYLLNLCYSEEKRTELTLQFAEAGTYTMESLQVIAQPTAMIPAYVKAYTAQTLQNVQIKTNRVSGTITLPKEKLLCLTIPYAAGFRIYVDGTEQKLMKVQDMFLGTVIPAGTHSVVLTYRTPYLAAGACISLFGILLAAGNMILVRRRSRH